MSNYGEIHESEEKHMADTKYTIVGMSSSGKTCFLTAMYMRMATGVEGFTLWTTEDTRRKFERDILKLRNGNEGHMRFPEPTPNAENATKLYEFRLIYDTKDIISFDVIDYAGGALRVGGPVYNQFKHSMEESTAMFIFIDGASLCDEDREIRKENVYYDCAISVTPLIQDFADSHNGQLPPIVFVVTKSDLCKAYIKNEAELVQIIRDLFRPAFSEGSVSYICAVSLGDSISDDGYKGRFSPVNVHIPLFLGSFHEYYNRCIAFKEKIEAANRYINTERDQKMDVVAKEKRKWSFFRNKELIDRCIESARNSEKNLNSNRELLAATQALYTRFGAQLEMESRNFKSFISGVEQPAFKPPRL